MFRDLVRPVLDIFSSDAAPASLPGISSSSASPSGDVLGTTDLLVRVLTAVHSVFNADAKS
jgi:hypothetical protein